MARNHRTITIGSDGGRDAGKVFIITEMSADAAERFAFQALALLSKAGAVMPEGAESAGMAGLAATGIEYSIAQAQALQDPSLDSLWDCVRYQHNPQHAPQPIGTGEHCQIEEIKTRMQLRMEVLNLHISFFEGAGPSKPAPARRTRGS